MMSELNNILRNTIVSAKRLTVQAYAKHLAFCDIADELIELSTTYIWNVKIEKESDFNRAFSEIDAIEKALIYKYKMSNDTNKFTFSTLITCINDYRRLLLIISRMHIITCETEGL